MEEKFYIIISTLVQICRIILSYSPDIRLSQLCFANCWGIMNFLHFRALMRLIDPSATDFDAIRGQFRWSIPEKLNVAYQVCERHQAQAQQIAVYYENVI